MDGKEQEESLYNKYFPEMMANFAGNLLADILLFPLETVLHRLYAQGTRTIIDNLDTGVDVIPISTNYEGFFDCFRSIVMEEGVSGLYRGFGALILQYALQAGLLKFSKYVFEKISKELNPPEPLAPIDRPRSSDRPTQQRQPQLATLQQQQQQAQQQQPYTNYMVGQVLIIKLVLKYKLLSKKRSRQFLANYPLNLLYNMRQYLTIIP